MDSDRAARIWTAVALRATRDRTPISPAHACLECVEALTVGGAGLMFATGSECIEPVYFTGPEAEEADTLQTTLGEGPGFDAVSTGQPILADNMASSSSMRQWPMLAAHMARLGVGAIHSFPLALGAIRVGALNLYSFIPRELDSDNLVDALVYADTALLLTLDARSGIDTAANGGISNGQTPALWRAEVHQAAGMVSAQLGLSVLDALVRLRAHAYSHDMSLTALAREVVERRVRFDQEGAADPAKGEP